MIYRLLFAVILSATLAACSSSEERAQAAYERGVELVESGDDARAAVEFRSALRYDDDHLPSFLELARLNLRADRLRPAYRNYLAVVEQEPDHVEGLQSLSRIAFLLQDWAVFERYGARAIAAAPDSSDSRVLGLVKDYREAIEAAPDSSREALIIRGEALKQEVGEDDILQRTMIDAYVNAGRFREALSELDAILARTPDDLDLYQLRLRILSTLGDTDGIETQLREMMVRFPDNDMPRNTLLRFLIGQGQTEEAETLLREQVSRAEDGSDARVEAIFTLTRFVQTERGLEAAMEELDSQIARSADSAVLQAMQAALKFESGEREAAITQLEGLLAREGDAAPAPENAQRIKVTLARMLLDTGNEVGARRIVAEALNEDPGNPEALKMQAAWQIEDDNTNAAIADLRTALAADPRDVEALTLMAQAYERSGETDLVLNFLSLATEASNNAPAQSVTYARVLIAEDRLTQAETTLIASLRVNPGNVAVLETLGALYLQTDDRGRLRQVVETLEGLENDDRAAELARTFTVELTAREAGRDQALALLAEQAEAQDADATAQLQLIRAQLVSGETEEALARTESLIEENPDEVTYRYLRGVTLVALQEFASAAEQFRQIVDTNPELIQPWLRLTQLEAVTGGDTEAMSTLERGLERNPDAAQLLWAKASVLERRGEVEEALAIYEELYQDNSNSIVIANNLASMLTTYRDDEESLRRAQVIARRLRNAEAPALQDTYGWILYRLGNVEESLAYLEPAANGLRGDPVVQVHLGLAYAALGRLDDARAQLDRAREAAGPLRQNIVDTRISALSEAIETAAAPPPATSTE